MPSSRRHLLQDGCPDGLIAAHPAIHLVADPAAEGADGLGLRVAAGHALLVVRATRPAQAHLGDRDAVEGRIELPVAPAVQPVTDLIA
jgi:hypothetical protein